MRLAGFSVGYIVRTGIAALIFLILFKWLARRTNVAPLQAAAAAA
jgi:hypothetical protein